MNLRACLTLLALTTACAKAAPPDAATAAPATQAAPPPVAAEAPPAAPATPAPQRAPTALGAATADDWTPQAAWKATAPGAGPASDRAKAEAPGAGRQAQAAPAEAKKADAPGKTSGAAAQLETAEPVAAKTAPTLPAPPDAQARGDDLQPTDADAPLLHDPSRDARERSIQHRRAPQQIPTHPQVAKQPQIATHPQTAPPLPRYPSGHGYSHPNPHVFHLVGLTAPHSDRTYRPLPSPPGYWPKDARYRSTYLPGRGYLAHLGTWLGRTHTLQGTELPTTPRVTVPSLPSPQGRSLDVTLDQDRGLLPPEGGVTTLRVRLRATDVVPGPRVPLRLHLVLDSSGSMRGASWQAVCAAVQETARVLQPQDLLSVVHYGDHAEVLSAAVPGQSPQIRAVAERVCKLKVRGETNIWDGLRLGYEQARASYQPDAVNRVLLVSDGMATVGPRDLYTLTAQTVRALGEGITTSALGVGADFDALLMERVALDGGGNDHFVRDVAAVPAVLGDELDVLAQEAAEAVDLRVRLPADVDLLEVIGSEPLTDAEAERVRDVEVRADQRLARDQGIAMDRQKDVQGGVRMLLPSFRVGDEHTVLLVVRMPAGAGARPIADVELRYKDRLEHRNVKLAGTRMVLYAPTQQAAETGRSDDVVAAEARARAAVALQRASEYLDAANVPRIRQELETAARQVRAAADLTGRAELHTEASALHLLADAAGEGVQGPRLGYLASVLHYQWRYCGVTAWRE
jgi:Ca-activated chloride channel family protein